jgi:hypothetical protein
MLLPKQRVQVVLVLLSMAFGLSGLGIIVSSPEMANVSKFRSNPYLQATGGSSLVRYAPWMVVIGGVCMFAAIVLREE